jgi:hypothetical protein
MRGDPVVRLHHSGKSYSVYFLPEQWDECRYYAEQFERGNIESLCGCKQIKYYGVQDKVKLSCASIIRGKLYGRRIAIYYYYNNSSIKHCIALRNHLMKKVYQWK